MQRKESLFAMQPVAFPKFGMTGSSATTHITP
jgi:hypothetical protein